MQIAVQLPDERTEAMTVLRLAGQLVTEFVEGDPPNGGAIRTFSIVR